MCHPSALLRLGLALFLLAFSLSAHALVLVRMETSLGNIDIELYDDIAPLTVANFLAYTNGGDYDGTFIHRSVPGFIIQGGGHFLNDGTREHIPERAPVPNEFNLSNTRGTLAMAKLPGDPDSATSEWFFNLADNSGNLDFQNGGFTVFGRVLGDGMDVVDAMAALQIIDAGGVYGDLPARNYSGGELADDNYVFIERIIVLELVVTPEGSLSMGDVVIGESAQQLITIDNVGSADIMVTGVFLGGVDAEEFSRQHDCALLTPAASCEISLVLSPVTRGSKQATLLIETNHAERALIEVAISGKGKYFLQPELEVSSTEFGFGDALLGQMQTNPLFMINSGDVDLLIDSISIIGPDTGDFSASSTCSNVLASGGLCSAAISFTPLSAGAKSATLVIASNDPDIPSMEIELNGFGRDSWIRVELETLEGGKVILRSPPGSRLLGAAALENLSEGGIPAGIAFKDGFIQFSLELPVGMTQGAVLISFPQAELPETYYKYGKTLDNATPHWYEFMWDDETQTGAVISKEENIVILYFKDGARGDDDLTVNGLIVDPGGPGYSIASVSDDPGSSGGGGCAMNVHSRSPLSSLDWLLVAVFLVLLGLRHECRRVNERGGVNT